ncbi:MAG TPA: VWA domain-containing protein [Thermoanaerobaculia bacterium]|nr:VWA domain-containing protein [Thermoanaerobaculia bacterium]
MNRRPWLSVFLLVAIVLPLRAQRVAETVEITVVEVPVTVVDRDGNPVRGLTAENFEVLDDGKRVPIEYFETVDLGALTTSTSEGSSTQLPPAATRHFLLLFDLANSAPGVIGRAGDAAKHFVQDQLGPRDLAAVATFTTERGARMITNFTRNRDLLVNAIETLGHPNYFKVGDPLMISAMRIGEGAGGGAGAGARGDIDAAVSQMAAEAQTMQQRTQDSELRTRLRVQLSNMGRVARALDGLHGQKQIILLSEGFDASIVLGREDLGSADAKAESSAVISGEVWNVDSEKRFGSTTSSRDVTDMVELFKRSDVVLHAIDIKGLRGNTDASTSGIAAKKTSESLHLLTEPTGGTVFKNANDINENFGKLLQQQEVVYLLGFRAKTTGKPGKFHQLRVKAVNAKSAKVAHRAGYYEPAALSDLERALTLAEILMLDAPQKDLLVETTAAALPGPQGKSRVPVVIEVPGRDLLKRVSGKAAHIDLFVYAFDKRSEVTDYLQERVTLDLAKAGDALKNGGVRYFGTLRLPPGKYAVKTLLRVEESELIGFDRHDIVVPSFSSASVLPPVFFNEPGSWAMIVGETRGDDYPYPFAAGQTKFIPKTDAALTANTEYKVALFLFKVPVENLSVLPTVVSANGTQTANMTLLGRTSPDETGLVKLLFNFKPPTLEAGKHEIRFDVKSNDGSTSTVTLPFTVE